MRASPKDLNCPVKILSHVSSDIWWAGKFMKTNTPWGEMFVIPVTAGRELGTGFGGSVEHLQLGGNFCKEFSFQSYRGRFSKVFLFWSFWKSLSLTHLQQAALLLPAPSFRSVTISTWWIFHTFPPRQIVIYTKSELWKLCWLQVNRCWLVLKFCHAYSWAWKKK